MRFTPSPRSLLVGLLPVLATTLHASPGEMVERRLLSMGTLLSLEVEAPSRDTALEASEAAVREVERVETLLSTWRPGGPLALLNEAPTGAETPANRELVDVLVQVLAWSSRTRGAFDPTILPLVTAWDLRGKGRIPDEKELRTARAAMGPSHFVLSAATGRVTRTHPRSGLDEGAWGKGYALDRAAVALREAGAGAALLDFGGQVLAVGGGRSWPVAIAHPRERARTVAAIALREGSISTSGNSERGFVIGARRVGHLLDPRTGQPARDFGSVSVVAPSALVADILSTAFFVLGPEDGLALSASLRAEGVPHEAVFFVVGREGLRQSSSPGFRQLLIPRTAGTGPSVSRRDEQEK